ncbi:hypothetical protein [Streptomyces sp. H27-D2]|uniref:hypothetical protein n=1 Tax=Streptomyces sp. H27-D2 TaxID=3046304 RepID=UPI002DB88129|nr:hypothetical protein [Streptomyces sp. H27-D2]MEC4015361.1 hypothetical protein [Streptomyces sp. H27-D2]
MGRKKLGKPRRTRAAATYTLRQLRPPGALYDEWVEVQRGFDASYALADDRLDEASRDLMVRLARLGPRYGRQVPLAALSLDMAIEIGKVALTTGDDQGMILPLAELGARFGLPAASEDVRAGLHELHAAGALLVEEHEDVLMLRCVVGRPDRPGGRWIMDGDPDAAAVPGVCIPHQARDELPPDQFGAFAYMQAQRAKRQEPDPEEYGAFDGVNGSDHARQLFAAIRATGWLDRKDCETCPAARLCTRPADSS